MSRRPVLESAADATVPLPGSGASGWADILPPVLFGMRALRPLARSSRSDVVLVQGSEPDYGSGQVVVKLYRSSRDREGVDREIVALHRAAGPHVVRALDVGTLVDGRPALIMPRLGRGSLGDLLVRRPEFSAGEAATILAPLAETLARCHRVGVAHGAAGPDHVLFDDAGSPHLIDFAAATLFAAGSPEVVLETVGGVVDDRRDLRRVAGTVLRRVRGTGAREAAALASRVETVDPADLVEVLVDGLFAFTGGSPLRWEDAVVEDSSAEGAGGSASTERPGLTGRRPATASSSPQRRVSIIDGALARVDDSPLGLLVSHIHRRRGPAAETLSPRRRALLGAVAAAVTLSVCLLVIPAPETSSAKAPLPGRESPTADGGPGSEAASKPASAGPTSGTGPDVAAVAVEGDDPAGAALVLLAARERCIRELSRRCLRDVTQAGSAAEREDIAAIGRIEAGGEQPRLPRLPNASELAVQEMGATAVVTLPPGTHPASLLLMRSEAGWRIRSYTADES